MRLKNKVVVWITFFSAFVIHSCQQADQTKADQTGKDTEGIFEDQIRRMEKLIPNSMFDTNHVAIWRSGSIFYSEDLSLLVIEKKQLKDKQLLCYYISFDSDKPSNYRNWKFANVYELTLENLPFKFPLTDKIHIGDLDTLSYTHGEGIESNNYFMADFKSDIIYPISRRYNNSYTLQVAKLFNQISKREKVQVFALQKDSVSDHDISRVIHGPDENCIIKEDREVTDLQRRYHDK